MKKIMVSQRVADIFNKLAKTQDFNPSRSDTIGLSDTDRRDLQGLIDAQASGAVSQSISASRIESGTAVPGDIIVTGQAVPGADPLQQLEARAGIFIEEERVQVEVSKPGEFTSEELQTRFFPGVSLQKTKFFGLPGGAIVIVGREDLARPDVTRQGTISEVRTFDPPANIFGIERREPIELESEFRIPKELESKDITREQTTIEEPPRFEQLVFEQRPPTLVEKLREKSFTETARGDVSFLGVGGGLVAGAIVSGVGTLQFVKGIITDPIETIGRTGQAILEFPKTAGKLGLLIASEPAFVTGFVAGEFAQFKAGQFAIKKVRVGLELGKSKFLDFQAKAKGRRFIEFPDLKKQTIAQKFAGDDLIAFRKGEILGDEIFVLEQARGRLPPKIKPISFDILGRPGKPTIRFPAKAEPGILKFFDQPLKIKPISFDIDLPNLRNQVNLLRSGADIIQVKKGVARIRPSAKPEALRTLDIKPFIPPKEILDIQKLSLKRFKSRPLEIEVIKETIPPVKIITSKEIFKEFKTPTRTRASQQLIQLQKPIKIKPPKLDVIVSFEDLQTQKFFPGFIQPTTRFGVPEGRIPALVTGRVSTLGDLGRIKTGELDFSSLKQKQLIKETRLEPPRTITEQVFRPQIDFAFPLPRLKKGIKPILGQPTLQIQPQAQPQAQAFRQPQAFKQPQLAAIVQAFKQPQRILQLQGQKQRSALFQLQVLGKPSPFGFVFPEVSFRDIQEPLRAKRTFQRTPSLGAVLKFDFGIVTPKLSKGLERTGLVERAFIAPKIIKPLGPFKL